MTAMPWRLLLANTIAAKCKIEPSRPLYIRLIFLSLTATSLSDSAQPWPSSVIPTMIKPSRAFG